MVSAPTTITRLAGELGIDGAEKNLLSRRLKMFLARDINNNKNSPSDASLRAQEACINRAYRDRTIEKLMADKCGHDNLFKDYIVRTIYRIIWTLLQNKDKSKRSKTNQIFHETPSTPSSASSASTPSSPSLASLSSLPSSIEPNPLRILSSRVVPDTDISQQISSVSSSGATKNNSSTVPGAYQLTPPISSPRSWEKENSTTSLISSSERHTISVSEARNAGPPDRRGACSSETQYPGPIVMHTGSLPTSVVPRPQTLYDIQEEAERDEASRFIRAYLPALLPQGSSWNFSLHMANDQNPLLRFQAEANQPRAS